MANGHKIPEQADIVIVGAGVSGLYCAWRLLEHDPNRSITIVERLNRTGGRLDTDLIRINKADGDGAVVVRDEEGGMRFTYDMKELMSLFNALGLCDQTVYFPMQTNRYAIDRKSFTNCEAVKDDNAIWGELYNLTADERNKSPGTLITEAYDRIVRANNATPPDAPTPEYWQRFRLDFKWNGIPLNQWTLWGLLRDMGYSEAAVRMFTETLGFEGPFRSLVNAGEAWQILEDFPKDPHYFTFRKGFSTLINALKREIERITGGNIIHLGAVVDSITDGEQGSYDLALTVAQPGDSAYPFESGGTKHVINGSQVILAVASKAMETLFMTSPALHRAPNARRIYEDIVSVLGMKLMKINLYYEHAWWENGSTVQEPVKAGPSFTDLPINAVYPFYPIEDASPNNPAALTIYCDFNNTNFWAGLQNVGSKFDSPLQREHSKPPQVLFPASQAVVREATAQFRQLFNWDGVPEPVMTSFRLWGGADDFGFGYHQWALNVNDRQVIKRMTRPLPRGQIYTCNESWSDMQGWVNGSLRSSDLVLDQFGLPPITTVSKPCPTKKPPADPKCVDGRYVYPSS